MHVLIEARRAAPAVLYLPHLQLWWQTAGASLRATLWMLLADLPPDLPLLLLAVAECPLEVPLPVLPPLLSKHAPTLTQLLPCQAPFYCNVASRSEARCSVQWRQARVPLESSSLDT